MQKTMVPLLDYPLGKSYIQVLDKVEQAVNNAESKYDSRNFIIFTSGDNNYIYPCSQSPHNKSLKIFHVQLPHTYSSKAGKTVYITAYGFDHKVEIGYHYEPKELGKPHPWSTDDYKPAYHVFVEDPNVWSSIYEVITHFHNKPLRLGDPVVFHDFCVGEDLYDMKRM